MQTSTGFKKRKRNSITNRQTPSRVKRQKQYTTPTAQKPAGLKRKKDNTPESLSPDDNRDNYMCSCNNKSALLRAEDYYICRRCLKHQHIYCATDTSDRSVVRNPICNICELEELQQTLETTQRETERMHAMVLQKREDFRLLYEIYVWQQYCILPDVDETHPEIIRLTRTKYQNGEAVPVIIAPQPWLDEVVGRVTMMIEEAEAVDPDLVRYYMHDASESQDPHELMQAWRELAKWLCLHGPYKKRRDELGVLAEVLGFVFKGMFWQSWIGPNNHPEDEDGEDGFDRDDEGMEEEDQEMENGHIETAEGDEWDDYEDAMDGNDESMEEGDQQMETAHVGTVEGDEWEDVDEEIEEGDVVVDLDEEDEADPATHLKEEAEGGKGQATEDAGVQIQFDGEEGTGARDQRDGEEAVEAGSGTSYESSAQELGPR